MCLDNVWTTHCICLIAFFTYYALYVCFFYNFLSLLISAPYICNNGAPQSFARKTRFPFPLELCNISHFYSQCLIRCVCVLSWPRLLISRIGLGPPSPPPTMSLDIIPGQSHSCILLLASPGIWTAIAFACLFCKVHSRQYVCTICLNGSWCFVAWTCKCTLS